MLEHIILKQNGHVNHLKTIIPIDVFNIQLIEGYVMGFRFRKSFKIAPGVKINIGKKSSSVTFGQKGAHYTINSKGKKTASVGIPGTGISYSASSGGGSKSNKSTSGKKSSAKSSGNGGSGGGCLILLLILIVIALAIWLYSFFWIAAIPALIYCCVSKKFRDYRKRNVLICLAVMITSFLVFIWLGTADELDSIHADWDKTTYDVSETATVTIKTTPASAEVTSLVLAENDLAELSSYSDGKAIVKFKKNGSEKLHFIANDDINSQEEAIIVTDETAIKAAQKKAEEAEQARLAEESKQAEEESLQAQLTETVETENESETEYSEKAYEETEEMVWIPASGSKYHSRSSCSGMNDPTQVTISEAQSRGYTACKKCH